MDVTVAVRTVAHTEKSPCGDLVRPRQSMLGLQLHNRAAGDEHRSSNHAHLDFWSDESTSWKYYTLPESLLRFLQTFLESLSSANE